MSSIDCHTQYVVTQEMINFTLKASNSHRMLLCLNVTPFKYAYPRLSVAGIGLFSLPISKLFGVFIPHSLKTLIHALKCSIIKFGNTLFIKDLLLLVKVTPEFPTGWGPLL